MDTGAECIKHLADDLRAGTSLVVPSATRLRRKPVERKRQEGVYSCYFCGRHIFQIPPQKNMGINPLLVWILTSCRPPRVITA